MAATLITARFNMLNKAQYEAARLAAEEVRRTQPNSPAGYADHYNSRAAYDLEHEMHSLGYYAGPELEVRRAALVAKYAERLPGLEITVGEPCQVGRTLSIYERVERVMSDVWENVRYIDTWDGEKVVTTGATGCVAWNYDGGSIYLDGLQAQNDQKSDYSSDDEVRYGYRHTVFWKEDADEATKEAAADYRAERARVAAEVAYGRQLMDDVEKRIAAALTPKQISYCRVVKGRKAPKGDGYQITYINHNGQYGPYAHLLSKDGKKYQYISLENLEAVPEWEGEFQTLVAPGAKEIDPTLNGLIRGLAETGDRTRWLIIADRLEDLGRTEMAQEVRSRATR